MNQQTEPEFDDLKAAVELLHDVLAQAADFETATRRLIAKHGNRFHSFDLLAYVTQIQNAVMNGTDRLADAADPGAEDPE